MRRPAKVSFLNAAHEACIREGDQTQPRAPGEPRSSSDSRAGVWWPWGAAFVIFVASAALLMFDVRLRAGHGGGSFPWALGGRGMQDAGRELFNASEMWIFSSKTSHLPPSFDEKELRSYIFSSTMNFKNGIAVQSND